MADGNEDTEKGRGGGDRRQEDRRQGDRRREDRRAPTPLWRRPWAYAIYGVLGALLLVAVIGLLGDAEGEPGAAELDVTTATPLPSVEAGTPAAGAPARDAYSVGEFEQLLAQGGAARGQRVRSLLFCEPTSLVALKTDVEAVDRSIAALADADRRVPAAQCRWSEEPGAPDFLLLIPPDLAERFAATPEVSQGFLRRRRVHAEVEWLGRSETLALRTAGVLRSILPE